MIKKILFVFLLVAICFVTLFSCKKTSNSKADPTRNYFPLIYGKYVTYAVDSVVYATMDSGKVGIVTETHCQLKYAVDDTFTDSRGRLSYILDVFYQPYSGSYWIPSRVIYLTPTSNSMLYTQDNTEYVKLMFPVQAGFTWQGNQYAQVQDSLYSYLANWNYTYQNYHLSYFNGLINYDNTVTVLEDNENFNYQNVDPLVAGFHTYAKEVYAYNVGMVYKEWTHYTWTMSDTAQIKTGYSVKMQAIDNN
jgi:hypothetical protein